MRRWPVARRQWEEAPPRALLLLEPAGSRLGLSPRRARMRSSRSAVSETRRRPAETRSVVQTHGVATKGDRETSYPRDSPNGRNETSAPELQRNLLQAVAVSRCRTADLKRSCDPVKPCNCAVQARCLHAPDVNCTHLVAALSQLHQVRHVPLCTYADLQHVPGAEGSIVFDCTSRAQQARLVRFTGMRECAANETGYKLIKLLLVKFCRSDAHAPVHTAYHGMAL